jgi:hypothetical protein
VARARGGCEDKGRWFALSVRSVTPEAGDQEKYTVARRMVIAERDQGQPPVVLRVYLNPHVDLELTAEAGRAYAAEDAAIGDAAQRGVDRAVGVSAVDVDRAADPVRVTIRAARPGVAWGFLRAAETEGVWRELAAGQFRG